MRHEKNDIGKNMGCGKRDSEELDMKKNIVKNVVHGKRDKKNKTRGKRFSVECGSG